MDRRTLLKTALVLPLLPYALKLDAFTATRAATRVRPGSAGWPTQAQWQALSRQVGGRLSVPRSPFLSDAASRAEAVAQLTNPFYIGDQVALTQTSGYFGAWTSRPSAYALTAERAEDIAAAVTFARKHGVRLVVKGGGHSVPGHLLRRRLAAGLDAKDEPRGDARCLRPQRRGAGYTPCRRSAWVRARCGSTPIAK